jgi:predicted nucleic acid-binding protein
MPEKAFVDTNILIYAHDRSAGDKHDRASQLIQRLWDSGTAVLSTQVLQELCINLRRRVSPALPVDEVRRLLQDYLAWEIVVNDAGSTLNAFDLEVKYKISFWDALILQAAEDSGATVLYSEDLAAGQHYGNILVINPLK